MAFSRTARAVLSLVVLCAVWIVAGLAQSAPEVGTWKLNVAQSKFDPGPATKSSTVTFSTAGQGVKTVVDGIGPEGAKVHWEYTANFDGKPYPVTGNADGDMVTVKRVNASTVEIAYTLKGKATMLVRRTLSANGKVLTITQTGTSGQGQKMNNVLVFER